MISLGFSPQTPSDTPGVLNCESRFQNRCGGVSSSVHPERGMSDSILHIRANISTSAHKKPIFYARAVHGDVCPLHAQSTAEDDRIFSVFSEPTMRGITSTRYFPSQIPGSLRAVSTSDCSLKWTHAVAVVVCVSGPTWSPPKAHYRHWPGLGT